jgi:tRNA threonylcarbamoyl adenosine modification protein (Sua5/YciO/YrdC/YwlC family)
MGEHLYTYVDPPNERHLEQICASLAQGNVLVFPMHNSWAFCCDPTSRKGIMAMYALKPEHSKKRPFSLVCCDISMASSMANIGGQSYSILRKLLPGAYTIILQSARRLPKLLKDKREKVGIRIPNEEITLEIIQRYGKPLAATSVPRGKDGGLLQMGYQIYEEFGHAISIVVDIGLELPATESTILDFSTEDIELIRQGAGSIDSLGF